MALVGYLKQGSSATLKIGPFLDNGDGITPETALTISQADVRLSKNSGDFAQKNESTSCTHDENGYYDCPINATDSNTLGLLTLIVNESGSLPIRQDYLVVSPSTFDITLFGPESQGVITSGSAQSGSTSNIRFSASSSFTDDIINSSVVLIVSGTGARQSRYIINWNNTTKDADVSPDWLTPPNNTSFYVVFAAPPFPTASGTLPIVTVASGGLPPVPFSGSFSGSVTIASGGVPPVTAISVMNPVTVASGGIPPVTLAAPVFVATGGLPPISIGSVTVATGGIPPVTLAAPVIVASGGIPPVTLAAPVFVATGGLPPISVGPVTVASGGIPPVTLAAPVTIATGGLPPVNTLYINGAQVYGAGVSGNLWRGTP